MALSNASLTENIRAPFWKSGGLGPNVSRAGAIDNNFRYRALTADGTGEVDIFRVDAEDNLQIGGTAALKPTWQPISFKAVANGNNVDTRFHVFNVSGRIKRIVEIHTTAGDHASAVTA